MYVLIATGVSFSRVFIVSRFCRMLLLIAQLDRIEQTATPIRHRNGNSVTGSDAKHLGQKDVLPLKIALGTHV